MGLLRFLLASSVVFSHLGTVAGLDLIGGWRAVQVFFMVSGFYMALVLDTKYRDLSYRGFISSRALRIFPAYYLMMGSIALHVGISYLRGVPCELFIPHCGKIDWNASTVGFVAFT